MSFPIGLARAALALVLLGGCGQVDEAATATPALADSASPAAAPGPPETSATTIRPDSPVRPASPPQGRAQEPDPGIPPAPSGSRDTQEEPERLLRSAAARYAEVRSLRATFAMETRNPLLRETVRSRGELFQRRPDRILLRFEEPAGDIIVSDGRQIWVWYPSIDSTQVLRSSAAAGAGGVDLLAQFVGDPTTRFAWTMRGAELVDGRTAAILALDPRAEEAYRQLVVWIDRADFLVRRFEITEHSGVVRRIELHDLVVDLDLPDSLFRFSPPPGARIVGAP